MNESTVLQEKVKFRPRARLLYVIGGDLIKDEMAGAVELVKNAYDADATWVRIAFRNLVVEQDEVDSDTKDDDEPKGSTATDESAQMASLIIEDNGHGMSRSTLEKGWLSPATGIKGREVNSPGGRPMQGRKGVGRFSAMRLGEKLVLETIPGEKAPELAESELGKKYGMELEWEGLEESEAYLDQLEFDLEIYDGANPKDHGVRLKVMGLRDQWGLDRIKRLIRELRLLLSPLPLKRREDEFEIHLDFESSGLDEDDIRKLPRRVEPYEIPQVADYVAIAEIDEYGEYRFSYERRLWTDKDSQDIVKEVPEEDEEGAPGPDIRKLFREEDQEMFPPHESGEKQIKLPCGPLNIRFGDDHRFGHLVK